MPNDYFLEVIDPNNPKGNKAKARLPHRLYMNYFKYHPVRYENLRATKYVLEHTARIFYGVRRFNEGGWCYTGRPESWCIREGVTAPFPTNLVYAVYLNSRLAIYEARAENAAQDDTLCPADWQNRYGGLTWKSTF